MPHSLCGRCAYSYIFYHYSISIVMQEELFHGDLTDLIKKGFNGSMIIQEKYRFSALKDGCCE